MSVPTMPAPGCPGVDLPWTSAAKTAIGTAADCLSQVWFSIADGVLTEIYYPRVDQACTRECGLIVTGDDGFYSPETTAAGHAVSVIVDAAAYRITNTCLNGRYRIEKRIAVLPRCSAVVQEIRFNAYARTAHRLFCVLRPRLQNHSSGNTAWIQEHEGHVLLMAQRGPSVLAMASSIGWLSPSVGYVGRSDAVLDLRAYGQIRQQYGRAENGAVSLAGELAADPQGAPFCVAVAFGGTPEAAARTAVASLGQPHDEVLAHLSDGWAEWDRGLEPLSEQASATLYRTSCRVIHAHEDKSTPGGIIASLSVPWGFARSEEDDRGYHLVWPRDLVKSAVALLAAGAGSDCLQVLGFLQRTQQPSGRWPQNMTVDGDPCWSSDQLDETASPILLLDLVRTQAHLDPDEVQSYWPMVKKAAEYLRANGPGTLEDRWENAPGYATYTIAIEVAALLAAADLASLASDEDTAREMRQVADQWSSEIDRWTYVRGTALARDCGVEGYYIRLAPIDPRTGIPNPHGRVHVLSRSQDVPANEMASPDALALVRYGLREPDDVRILNTLRVVDAKLRVDTPYGPAWRRYVFDGYGEHANGAAYDGNGIGRAWPLLTGERAHYELCAGNHEKARELLRTMEYFANECGLLPEQVWDAADIPERGLYLGRATGSARPLVWAHAEYVTLCRSLRDGRIFDQPRQTLARYLATASSA